jgi:uncharacterized membrane protein HdeD (DUF308 family)
MAMFDLARQDIQTNVAFYTRHWWTLLLRGVLSIIAGLIALVWPGIAVLTLAILVGAFFLWSGFWEVSMSLALRRAHKRTT